MIPKGTKVFFEYQGEIWEGVVREKSGGAYIIRYKNLWYATVPATDVVEA